MTTSNPTRSYGQLCGIAAGLDILGDRWALLIVRDLLLGPLRFGDLAEGLPGIGTNTLTARLKQLESSGVVSRRLVAPPERATAYELTDYGRDLEPILLALGRWGTRSMDQLPENVVARSRWLAAALLAFHHSDERVARATSWELRLRDGVFTARAHGSAFSVTAGAPDQADAVVTVDDPDLHRLLTRQVTVGDAVASGIVRLEGDPVLLERLIDLCAFA